MAAHGRTHGRSAEVGRSYRRGRAPKAGPKGFRCFRAQRPRAGIGPAAVALEDTDLPNKEADCPVDEPRGSLVPRGGPCLGLPWWGSTIGLPRCGGTGRSTGSVKGTGAVPSGGTGGTGAVRRYGGWNRPLDPSGSRWAIGDSPYSKDRSRIGWAASGVPVLAGCGGLSGDGRRVVHALTVAVLALPPLGVGSGGSPDGFRGPPPPPAGFLLCVGVVVCWTRGGVDGQRVASPAAPASGGRPACIGREGSSINRRSGG